MYIYSEIEKKKNRNWSETETLRFMELLNSILPTITGPFSSTLTNTDKANAFETVSQQLKIQYGYYRNAESCKVKWRDIRSKGKEKVKPNCTH